MKAIILAAGIGSRMMPLTKNIPKCLLKINNKTILEIIIESCISVGIEDFIFVVGYNSHVVIEKIKKLKNRHCMKYCIIENKEYINTNTGVSLYLALSHPNVKGASVIVINGDNVFDKKILEILIMKDETSIVVDNVKELNEESFKIKITDGKIEAMGKDILKETSTGEFIGISMIKNNDLVLFREILKKIIDENKTQYYDFAFKEFSKIKKIGIIYTNGLMWSEIDYPEDLERAKRVYRNCSYL